MTTATTSTSVAVSPAGYLNGILYMERTTEGGGGGVLKNHQNSSNNNNNAKLSQKDLLGAVGRPYRLRSDQPLEGPGELRGATGHMPVRPHEGGGGETQEQGEIEAEEQEGEELEEDELSDSSCGSMETLSDNVAIWVDGEKHWVSGVDANTTCTDLICALLNYKHPLVTPPPPPPQPPSREPLERRHEAAGEVTLEAEQETHQKGREEERPEEEDEAPRHEHIYPMTIVDSGRGCGGGGSASSSTGNESHKVAPKAINQSAALPPPNKTKDSSADTQAATAAAAALRQSARWGQLYEYVIVKQHRHCEEYLDGSTKVFDVLPSKELPTQKQGELQLRRLGSINTQVSSLLLTTPTDKDSGMGSPVGSARSARFRRRKHKSATWLAQANTLHPRLAHARARDQQHQRAVIGDGGVVTSSVAAAVAAASAAGGIGGTVANERLMKIIMQQDETIHRQLSLLREKERQISRIEEEKHRVRERELGKNYLLETYLNGLDEAEAQGAAASGMLPPDDLAAAADDAGVGPMAGSDSLDPNEIFIDEPFRSRYAAKLGADGPSGPPDARLKAPETKTPSASKKKKKDKDRDRDRDRDKAKEREKAKEIEKEKEKEKDKARLGKKFVSSESSPLGSSSELELHLHWLEKVYSVNKQLQREEEQLVKLHAKIRKHQLKRMYHTKREVLLQIDQLDAQLASTADEMRGVESSLFCTDEQLLHKLAILERLREQDADEPVSRHVHEVQVHAAADNNQKMAGEETRLLVQHIDDCRLPAAEDRPTAEDLLHLQRLIAKEPLGAGDEETALRRPPQETPLLLAPPQLAVTNGLFPVLDSLHDKNMLALHVPHGKTMKKQMFGPKCAALNAASASATSSSAATAATPCRAVALSPALGEPSGKQLNQLHEGLVVGQPGVLPPQPPQPPPPASILLNGGTILGLAQLGLPAPPPPPPLPPSSAIDISRLGTLV